MTEMSNENQVNNTEHNLQFYRAKVRLAYDTNKRIQSECEHDWSNINLYNYQCIQCNRSTRAPICEYCSHDDIIRCRDDFQCTKCKQNKGSHEQPLEFRAYLIAQNSIRTGIADPSDPIIKYTQCALDLQEAYCKSEYQKILDKQNAALLEHINKLNTTNKSVFDYNDKSTWNCPLSDTDRRMLEQSVKNANSLLNKYSRTCLEHEAFLFRKNPTRYKPYE